MVSSHIVSSHEALHGNRTTNFIRIRYQDIWKLLLANPLGTPADLVNTIFDLELSTAKSPKPKPGDKSTKYYIRTYAIEVSQFRSILERMVEDGYGSYDQVSVWLKNTDEMEPTSTITVRYCGKSTNRPWDRHYNDVMSSAESSFIVRFLRMVSKRCPDVLAEATVQIVTRISTTFKRLAQDIDITEQVLIVLFGDGILNIETGGDSSMKITGDDHTAFTNLGNVNLVKLLRDELRPCPPLMRQAVEQYAGAVRKYVDANESTTNSNKFQFTDETERIITQQGTPKVLPGTSAAVMVTLGSDIGELYENKASPFFAGASKASRAVSDCYNYFALWEQDASKTMGQDVDHNLVKSLALDELMPFANLFGWFKKDPKDYPAARILLYQYLTAVKPMVVLAFGELVSDNTSFLPCILLTDF